MQTSRRRHDSAAVPAKPARPRANLAADPAGIPAEPLTLEGLHVRLGPPDERLRGRLFQHTREVVLGDMGERIQAQAIIDDVPLFVAAVETTLAELPPARRELVEGMPALIVDETIALRRAQAEHDAALAAAISGVAESERSSSHVTQRALDRQSGRVLLLIGATLRASFEASAAEPSALLQPLHRIGHLFEAETGELKPPAVASEPAPADGPRSLED